MVVGGMCGIRRDAVNERAVRILLECMLVFMLFSAKTLQNNRLTHLGIWRPCPRKSYIYRLQTKFAKVIFSQVFVCPRGAGGLYRGGLSGRPPVRLRAGGTHPTGMHSCLALCTLQILNCYFK